MSRLTKSAEVDPVRADFRNFLFLIWKHLKLPDPTPVQYDIASYMQHGPQRLMVQAFRGVGKSWIAAAFALWSLHRDHNLNIVVISASKQRADAFTQFMLRLIDEVPVLQYLRPKDSQRRSMICFDVGPAKASQTASVTSVGIYGQATGMRADILIPDDIEVPNNSETVVQREKLSERVKEFDAILKPSGRIIYLGTPQTEDSIYRELGARGYDVRVWPIRYPEAKQLDSYAGTLAPMIANQKDSAGRSTEPSRFTDIDIAGRELSYGRAGFALQFMLDTRISDGDMYPLKLADLMVHPLDARSAPEKLVWCGSPEYVIDQLPCVGMRGDRYHRALVTPDTRHRDYTGCVMAIDPGGKGADETGYAVVAILHGLLFVHDVGGLKGYGNDTMTKLAEVASRYGVNHVVIEENFGGGMFGQLLKPVLAAVHPCTVEEVRHSAQKEKRIVDTLEPVVSGHRMVVNYSLIQKDYDSTLSLPPEKAQAYRLFYQMTRLTRQKGALVHDDRLDALAIAVAYWTEAMARDVDKAVNTARQKDIDKALRQFVKTVKGRSRDAKTVWARTGHE